jgi:hypothetical protein
VAGIAVALVVGAWSVNQAYASGPGGVVVAALTVVDPFVAVGIGVGLYGEAAGIGALTAAAQAACAAAAVVGVAALARHLPEPRQKAIRTPAVPRELVGAGLRDQHGSSS